jgi:hypothetical protein
MIYSERLDARYEAKAQIDGLAGYGEILIQSCREAQPFATTRSR